MSAATPLDSLKIAVLRADEHLSIDELGDDIGPQVDAVRRMLWLTLAEHVPGLTHDGIRPRYATSDAWREVHTHDDGTAVFERIELSDRSYVHWYPRLDGERSAFVARFVKPERHLHAVEELPASIPACSPRVHAGNRPVLAVVSARASECQSGVARSEVDHDSQM